MKVMPFGPTDFSPSAMNRNEAPQITPGSVRISQSTAVTAGSAVGPIAGDRGVEEGEISMLELTVPRIGRTLSGEYG